jgi:hypothetical protein
MSKFKWILLMHIGFAAFVINGNTTEILPSDEDGSHGHAHDQYFGVIFFLCCFYFFFTNFNSLISCLRRKCCSCNQSVKQI